MVAFKFHAEALLQEFDGCWMELSTVITIHWQCTLRRYGEDDDTCSIIYY